MIARGAHAQAIRQHGLTVIAGDSRIEARVACLDDAAELGPQDLIIVAVKGPQLPAIARPLGRLLESGAHAVFAMNGILWWFADGLPLEMPAGFLEALDPGDELRRRIPADRVIGAVVNSSNEVIAPGVILNTTPQRNRVVLGSATTASPDERLWIPAAAGMTTPREERHWIPAAAGMTATGVSARAIADASAALARAGYDAPVTSNIRQHVWEEMVLYVAVSSVATLTHHALDKLVCDPGAHALMTDLMQEGTAIGRCLGFDLRDDADERLAFFRDKPVRPSMLQDFELGREPELAGSILAFEAIAGAARVAVPRLDVVATLLRLKARNESR